MHITNQKIVAGSGMGIDVEGKMQHKTGKEITTENIGPETVVLNAIDGGFIQVQRR